MRRLKTPAIACFMLASLVLAGCGTAPIPVASNFDYSVQHKVRSAGHWNLMADDVVQQTLGTLQKNGVGSAAPVYVQLPTNASAFDRGFREFVLTKLVQSSVPVMESGASAELQLSYATQVVVHKSARPHYIPGQFTMLAGGLMAAYGLRTEHLDTKLVAALGLAGAADFANSVNSGGPTHTEVILTTSVSRGGQFVARKTDVYYLEDVDAPLFLSSSTYPARQLKVVGQ